jgi:hypothetical protein
MEDFGDEFGFLFGVEVEGEFAMALGGNYTEGLLV